MELINQPSPNLFERFNTWIQESIMIKLISIGFLVLILLIPSAWIQSLIEERQQRANEAVQEIATKWSRSQTISGPVLVIPYRKQEVIDRGNDGKEIHERIEKAFFLPELLDVGGIVNPEILHRGIFEAVVYDATLQVKSTFQQPDFKSLNIPDNMVLWSDAYMVFGITDLRGINENPVFTVGDSTYETSPTSSLGIESFNISNDGSMTPSREGIMAKLGWVNKDSFKGSVVIKIELKGSNRLDFIPGGKTTTVKLSGPWNDPSFDGEFLPDSREITESGFNASWKVLHFNRPFPQQWADGEQQLSGANFGVKLLIPVDQYQKSTRTSKYGALVILLTFIALFLVEIIQKIRIHPFQYILIGAALIIYYTLLLSFSEHFGYNTSYIVSSIATVTLVSLYSTTFLRTMKLTILFTLLLVVFYSFIFVIILQQDFSLLLGSIGLFLIVGLLMYFSRKIKWYKEATT
ncbi:MAG: cell envelope integrity protein CreD [Bacteroidota bacterium]